MHILCFQTEQIRRANQLWTNDSLYLRKKILIPCSGRECEGGKHDHNGSTNSELETHNSSFSCAETTLNSSQDESLISHHNHNCSHPLCDSHDESEVISANSSSVSLKLDPRSSSSPNLNGITLGSISSDTNGCVVNGCQNGKKQSEGFSPSSSHMAVKRPSIVDKSEKSVADFLSRIDSSIASNKTKVQDKSQCSTSEWVTFDSENDPNTRCSRTSSVTGNQGRQIRYSLRKLERTQNELFQL